MSALITITLGAGACDTSGDADGSLDAGDKTNTNTAGDAPDGPVLPLTCELLAGPNCWGDAVAAAAACTPTSLGPVAADKRSCGSDDGTSVSFAQPLDPEAFFPPTDVEVWVGDTVCFHAYEPQDGTAVLETDLGITRTEYFENSGTLRLECPDGTAYESEAFRWAECPEAGQQEANPAFLESYGGDNYSLAISGAGNVANNVVCCSGDSDRCPA